MNINEQFGNKLIVKDDVKITIDDKDYFYFMTNNYAVICEKLKEYGCRSILENDFYENHNLSQKVKKAMSEVGACWSLTVSNDANVLNLIYKDKNYIAFLKNLKQAPHKWAKNLTEEYRKAVWKEICSAWSSIYNNPAQDMKVLKNWDLAFFCSNLVRGKPAEYYLYLMINMFQSNILKEIRPFSEILDVFINRHIEQGGKISDIYKKAGMNKQTFSRIRSGQIERPTLDSILQLSIGLRLSWLDMLVLTDSAGYLNELREKTGNVVFGSIVNQNYDIDSINEQLWQRYGKTLGFNERAQLFICL